MYLLGINAVYHESSACLLRDGILVALAEEERFNRVKHGKKPRIDNPDQLPYQAIRCVLSEAGIPLSDVSHVAYSADPAAIASTCVESDVINRKEFAANILRVPGRVKDLGFRGEFVWVDHHAAHAASTYYPSGFSRAAIISVDGIGDSNTTATFHGVGNKITQVQEVRPPHSIGFLWELCSMFLGFDIYDATKIMGLAAYGNPRRFAEQFGQLVRLLPDGRFETDQDSLRFIHLDYVTPSGYFGGLERLFGLARRWPWQDLTNDHYDLAAALQAITDALLLHLARHARETTGADDLCLVGGVALNCVTNQRVFEEGPFKRMFIQPACHDGGTSLGAALYLWHHLLDHPIQETMTHAYWGPRFSDDEIESALHESQLSFTRPDDIETVVAQLIMEGNVVGWFQGRMEVGPRALGNRSLLADPRRADMREMLNHKVKHREPFRPFAPSVLAEEAANWFEIAKETPASAFMLMAYPAREDRRAQIPAVLHTDFTGRIQTVRREANPRFHRLISEFQKRTGVPIVLNTSFNDSEPIVCSPRDAIHTFLKTRIDCLVMEGFLVRKVDNEAPVRAWQRDHQPGLTDAFSKLASNFRVTSLAGNQIFTDRLDYVAEDAVTPLFPEHQFFVDEIVKEKMKGALALEIASASAALSLAAVRAGARHVTAIESNARARSFAGLNTMLNRGIGKVDLLVGSNEVFAPVVGRTFDYILSDPPFGLIKGDCGPYGQDGLIDILVGLDAHLSTTGHAQIGTVGFGDDTGPSQLIRLVEEHLPGPVLIRVNPVVGAWNEMVRWLYEGGMVTADRARELLRRAREDSVTRLYLCMIHYEKGPRGVRVETARKEYADWSLALESC